MRTIRSVVRSAYIWLGFDERLIRQHRLTYSVRGPERASATDVREETMRRCGGSRDVRGRKTHSPTPIDRNADAFDHTHKSEVRIAFDCRGLGASAIASATIQAS